MLTSGVAARPVGSFSPVLYICSAPGPIKFVSVGLLLKGSPGTTSISGKRSTIALTCMTTQLLWAFAGTSKKQCQLPGNKMLGAGKLTATDLPVPLSPMMSTPPILGSITFSKIASFISSCPAILTKGRVGILSTAFARSATTAATAWHCRLVRC